MLRASNAASLLPACIPRSPAPRHSIARRIGFDLLRVPLVGRFLRWRHARLALQLPMMALAGVR